MVVRRPGRIWRGLLAILVGGSFALWAHTRSSAFERAEKLFSHAQDPEAIAQALRLSRDHLTRQPWDRQAARLAGLCLSRLDFPELAEPYYRQFGSLNLEDSHARAYAILRSNQREKAIQAYQEIAQHWPEDPRAFRLLGGIYLTQRQYENVLDVAGQLSKLPGGELDGHRMAGNAHHLLLTPEAAVAEYEAVLKLDPELKSLSSDARSPFWMNLATDLLSLGQAERVVDLLQVELARRGDPVLRTLLGKAYYQRGEFSLARDCLERAVEVDPRLDLAWLELGRLALAENRLDDARSALETALSLSPSGREILFSLKTVYQRLGLAEQARIIQMRSDTLQKESPAPPQGMGARSELSHPQSAEAPLQADHGKSSP